MTETVRTSGVGRWDGVNLCVWCCFLLPAMGPKSSTCQKLLLNWMITSRARRTKGINALAAESSSPKEVWLCEAWGWAGGFQPEAYKPIRSPLASTCKCNEWPLVAKPGEAKTKHYKQTTRPLWISYLHVHNKRNTLYTLEIETPEHLKGVLLVAFEHFYRPVKKTGCFLVAPSSIAT